MDAMAKRYFFFDIDGTLTDLKTGRFVPSALETIRKLNEDGHFTAIATGRAVYKTIPAAQAAGIHNYVANGGAALVINDILVKNRPLDKEKALQVIRQADERGYGILVATGDTTDVVMRDHRFLEQIGERREPTVYHFRPDLKYEEIPEIYKFYLSVPGEDQGFPLQDLIGHIRMPGGYYCYQHDEKDQGIRDMMAYLGADPKDAVVFGDGENDLSMIRFAGCGVAMGNGCDVLKEAADYIAEDIDNDGLYKACEHFSLL